MRVTWSWHLVDRLANQAVAPSLGCVLVDSIM